MILKLIQVCGYNKKRRTKKKKKGSKRFEQCFIIITFFFLKKQETLCFIKHIIRAIIFKWAILCGLALHEIG